MPHIPPIDLGGFNPKITHYLRPRTVDEALALHEQHGDKACWAGGWALAGSDAAAPEVNCVIALDHIRLHGTGLNAILEGDDILRVGALTPLQDILDHPLTPPALKAAAAFEPSRALRCTMTLGGDVAARRHDSRLAAALMALGTVLELAGDAVLDVNQYVAHPRRDLILFARIPLRRQAAVLRHRRSARGAVVLTAAVGWNQDGSNVVAAVAGSGLPLQRLPEAEHLLETQGAGLAPAVLEKTVRKAVRPASDWTGSAAYKAHLAAVSVADCVLACRQGRQGHQGRQGGTAC